MNDVVTLPLNPDEFKVDPQRRGLRIRVEETQDTEATARQRVAAMMRNDPRTGLPGVAAHLAHTRGYCDECGKPLWTSLFAEDLCGSCRVDRLAEQSMRRESLTQALDERRRASTLTQH